MIVSSAVLVGRSSLLISCADKLRQAGVEIVAVATKDPSVARYATERGIRVTSPDRIFLDLGSETFDYLISVVNMMVLPPEVLAMPQVAAVNFHDGPLPEMRGAHVSAWSVYLGKSMSCATWHLMNVAVDEGAVVAERSFPLSEYSTALSVMYDSVLYGAEAFDELVPSIVKRELPPVIRDSTPSASVGGTFFGFLDRPSDGIIHAGMSGREMTRLGRAYDHGRSLNPLGVPLLVSGDSLLYLRQVREVGGSRALAKGSPPRVERVTRSSILLATSDGGVALSDFIAMDGAALSGEGAAQRLRLRPCDELEAPDADLMASLVRAHASLRRDEQRWRRALRGAESLRFEHAPFTADSSGYDRCDLTGSGHHDTASIVDAFLSSLAQAVCSEQVSWSFAYSTAEALELHQSTGGYAVQRVPVPFLGGGPAELRSSLVEIRGSS